MGSALVGLPRTERVVRTLSSDGPRPAVCGNCRPRIKQDGYVADWNWFSDYYPSSFFAYYRIIQTSETITKHRGGPVWILFHDDYYTNPGTYKSDHTRRLQSNTNRTYAHGSRPV